MNNKNIYILIICILTSVTSINAQSPKEVCNNMLKAISGKVEKQRDWETIRHMFIPQATFTAVHATSDSTTIARTLNLEEFVRSFQLQTKKGAFSEVELGSKVNMFGGIAQVFQAYKVDAGDYHQRGINSIQLVKHQGKWLIASTTWTEETAIDKIPGDMIHN